MATAGQIKPKIENLRKKIADPGAKPRPGGKRSLMKRLKRMQRRRRVLLRQEAKVKDAAAKGRTEAAGAAAETPSAS